MTPTGNPHHLATPSGRPRARTFLAFDGEPGPCNTITDVAGVSVGYMTIIEGDGALVVGKGPIRTGVTAILPRPRDDLATPCFAGIFSQNGNGELTGTHIVEETGAFDFPITITNTHSCGVTRDATLRWMHKVLPGALEGAWGLPVAAETYDGFLNDINGHHVTDAHVFAALEKASSGRIEEGSVGGGTGMIAFGFKGGSGTASRRVRHGATDWTVGVFVQANFGDLKNFSMRGRHVGEDLRPLLVEAKASIEKGSIIAIVATDAPFLPHQMKRLARRVPLGIALTGGFGYHSSGDIFLAFSTANRPALTAAKGSVAQADFIPDAAIDPFFDAVVQSVEEAILNAMIANEDMRGRDDHIVPALPKAWLTKEFFRPE